MGGALAGFDAIVRKIGSLLSNNPNAKIRMGANAQDREKLVC
jgi:hypothetical protein